MKIMLNFCEEQDREDKHQLYLLYNKPFSLQEDIDLINHPEIILVCDNCERKLNYAASMLLILTPIDRKDYCFTCFYKLGYQDQKISYYVRPNMNASITEDSWNFISQLLLINALQKYEYGNWSRIKNYLDYHGHNFNEKQIQQHYQTFYNTTDGKPIFSSILTQIHHLNSYIHTQNQLQVILPQRQGKQEFKIQAFNSKRQESLFDYDPSAQKYISDLEFLDTDSPQEIQLKIKKIEEYDYRIIERQKRQRFVSEHKILSEQYCKILLGNGKLKNQIKRKMSCFSRFQTHEESEQLVNYITLQETLKGTVLELQKQRKRLKQPFFNQAYEQLNKKNKRIMEGIKSNPRELNITYYNPSKKRQKSQYCSQKLTFEEAKKKLKSIDFIKNDAKIILVSKIDK